MEKEAIIGDIDLLCPACGVVLNHNSKLFEAWSIEVEVPLLFYKCEACGCLYAPQAAKLATQLYANRESANFSPQKLAFLRFLKRFKLRLDYLSTLRTHAVYRLVDYGCGNGDLANAFVGYVGQIVAIDVPKRRPTALHPSIEYRSVADCDSSLGDGKNLIILRHVLEHFEEPVRELTKLAKIAHSGDMFIVETPNANSIFRRIMGSGWPGFFPPFHVTVPSAKALSIIAAKADLLVLKTQFREPAIIGTWFNQRYRSGTNFFRCIGLVLYPMQWLVSKITRRSEAVELTLCKR